MNKPINNHKTMKRSILFLLLLPFLLMTSCDFFNAGLGDKIDLRGPVLSITSPSYMENVQNDFTLTGTIKDDYGVASLSITVDRLDREWRNLNGSWQSRADGDSTWSDYNEGTWTQSAEGTVNWSLDMSLEGTGSGEFMISAVSVDTSENSDSNSFLDLMVVFDNTPPVLTVISPALLDETAADAATVFNTYSLQSTADMDKMLNGDILFRWSIADDFSVGDLHLELADALGNIYYQIDMDDVDRNGEHSISAEDIIVPEGLGAGAGSPVTDKTYLQIITTCQDKAGNGGPVANGWLCYYPEADTPWIEMSLSADNASPSTVYPEFTLQGQAFDDDSIKSVELTLYSGLTASGSPLSGYPVTLENSRDSRNFTWSFVPPSEAGEYSIKVSCIGGLYGTDEDDLTSDIAVGFFEVEDISIPRITVDSPAQDTSLFGDSSGDITFSGICDDDSGVSSLRLYWVDPHGSDPSTTQLSYMDATSSDWTNGTYPRIDSDTGTLFSIPMDDAVIESGRSKRSFSYSLNLFSDLGVSASAPLKNQVFLLRAEDDNGKTKVLSYSTSGDSQAPSISIDFVSVNSGEDKEIVSNLTLPAFQSGDTVVLRGSWSDDSYAIWDDVSKIILDSFMWNGTDISASIHLDSDGSWYSDSITPPSGSVASLSATLTDWGGNTGYASESFFVESDNPQLIRITSSNPDGAYKAGETIDLQLDFNKAVTFSGGSSNPVLNLNTGGTASYISGNGGTTHYYSYTVASGDNVVDLEVSSIESNDHDWTDISGDNCDISLPSGVNALSGGKDLRLDTTAPTVSGVEAVSSAGSFKVGNALYIALEFSENVVLSGTLDLQLELSSGTNVYADYLNTSSPTRLLFQYIVSPGENSADLAVDSLVLNSTTIEDMAGNSLNVTLSDGSMSGTHVIDTGVPAAPIISGISAGNSYEALTFSLTGLETGCAPEYSVDGGTSWQDYSSPVDLDVNGSYTVTARQSDAAGNVSPEAADITVNVDIGALLTRISADTTDGIYNDGDSMDITLFFRKNITVVGTPTITLNTSPPVDVDYSSGSGSDSLIFTYSVGSSENVSNLSVSSIHTDGSNRFEDADGTNVNTGSTIADLAAGMNLADQKNIQILNGIPVLDSVDLTGDTLTLSFSRNIYKGTGSIELAQVNTGYRIPSVMTQARYDEIYNAADAAGKTALESSYSWTTNGASASGIPDLDGKYVLNFILNNDEAALIAVFRSAGAHLVSIPVASSNVSVSGSDLIISLTGGYSLPVQGASFDMEVPAGLVKDVLANSNLLYNGSITSEGVDAPVIRVDKQSESLRETGGTVVADQPLTVAVKIDCETPGADIYYLYTEEAFASEPIANPNGGPAPPVAGASPDTPLEPGTGSNHFTAAFTIGNAGNETDGYKYLIRARAWDGSAWSDSSYEAAYRSVLIFDNDRNASLDLYGYTGSLEEQVWVRGGDSVSGTTITPGFPLSWDQNEYDMVRLMTDNGSEDWYWVSWELNSAAFVGLLLGTTPATLADAADGPRDWAWGKNAWTGAKAYYPVFPGESRTLQSSLYDTIDGQGRGAYGFAEQSWDIIYHR